MRIKALDTSSLDKEELVRFYIDRRRSATGRDPNADEISSCRRHIENVFSSFVTKSFLVYESDRLVGWLGINEIFPSTMLFQEYHPVIVSTPSKKQIAQKLIQVSIKYAREKNIKNIRVFVEVFKSENRFPEFEQYYLHGGMKKTHVVRCMENHLSCTHAWQSEGVVISSDYRIESMKSQTRKSLKNCWNKIFAESLDNFTMSLDDEERVYWDFFQRGEFNEASTVIKKENELVGLTLAVDRGGYVELGPIGVVSSSRGKGLGKALMERCLSSLIRQGKLECYLEVDETNIPAINLYTAYNFSEVSKKHGFLLRIET